MRHDGNRIDGQERLRSLFEQRYGGGFRLDSPIEMKKLRIFYQQLYQQDLDCTDEEIRAHIAAFAIRQGGKAYFVCTETKERLRFYVEVYLAGSDAIFYEAFFLCHRAWLMEGHIYDEAILIAVLQSVLPALRYEKTYFGKEHGAILDVVERELLRVWGDRTKWSFDDLERRLYIPLERIKMALTQRSSFVWVAEGVYARLSDITIRDTIREALRKAADDLSAEKGFFSLKALPIEDVVAENYELETKTNSALYEGVYQLCLADAYEKKGDILTRKHKIVTQTDLGQAQKMTAMARIRRYCLQQDACTISEVREFAKDFAPQTAKVLSMRALGDTMVRIDAEHYIADPYVTFDVEETDEAISAIVKGQYLPLRSFVTFARFPACGQAWNLFLLESYCRRFSRKFRFDVPAPNVRCAGTVIRKTYMGTYEALLADAVQRNRIPLGVSEVGSFLHDAGYVDKIPKSNVLEAIIAQVKMGKA